MTETGQIFHKSYMIDKQQQGMSPMNKNIISPILFAILSTQAYAAPLPQSSTTTDSTSSLLSTPPAPKPQSTTQTTTTAPTPAPIINCNYHIPANQTAIDSALITSWTEKATLQSFSFSPATIDSQLDALKPCFTEQGWKGFSEALQKSGNIESIKTQQLNVSSQSDGATNINTVKDNQWKLTLPIQVVYQNTKEKVTQRLAVTVLVGRKPNGDLGIMQMIASARPEDGASTTNNMEQPQSPPTQPTAPTSNVQQPTAPSNDTPAPTNAPPANPTTNR